MTTPVETIEAVERSTFVIRASFADRNGTAVNPTGLTWTLTDEDGTVINDRRDVSASASGGYADIALSGADLAVDGTDRVKRILSVSGTYTAAHGSSPVRDEVHFFVRPMQDADRTLAVNPIDLAVSIEAPAVAEDS